jgi:Sel1 repeat
VKIGKATTLMLPALFAIALLLASCEQSVSGGGATYKKGLVHDRPSSDAISAGDAAAAAKDFSGAMREYQRASSDKDTQVQASAFNRIGELYESGLGVAQDHAESVKWFKKAALLGNAYGEANLGNCLFFGMGANRDLVEAERWAAKGAERSQRRADEVTPVRSDRSLAIDAQLTQYGDSELLRRTTRDLARVYEGNVEYRLDVRRPGRQHNNTVGQVDGLLDVVGDQQRRVPLLREDP